MIPKWDCSSNEVMVAKWTRKKERDAIRKWIGIRLLMVKDVRSGDLKPIEMVKTLSERKRGGEETRK